MMVANLYIPRVIMILSFYILQPELVSRVEKDLLKIMAGGTADNVDILVHSD